MIKSITIRDVACYDHEGVTFDKLAKVNLIFGGNGTGKTTLSRVLEDAGQYKSSSVEWEGEPVDVLAYNRDFRERNLQQDIPGVFTIGEEYIKTERDLDYWRERRGIRGTGTSIHAFMCLKNVCK